MGSYAQCWLGSFYVGSSKNDIDPSLIHLFRASDKKVLGKGNSIPAQLEHWFSDYEDDEMQIVFYCVSISIVRDRLDLLGYTLENAKKVFEEHLKHEITLTEESCKGEKFGKLYQPKLEILRSLTIEAWQKALSEIRSLNLERNARAQYEGQYANTLIGYMLSEEWYGFPGYDINAAMRLCIEIISISEEFIYDVTDLVSSGYFDVDTDLVDYGLMLSADEFSTRSKTIVLTEGKSDGWILSESLNYLYPHLADYFSFMDFDNYRPAGGVGYLVNLVKSFAGANIINRTIALFDNDTSAKSAIRSLSTLALPRQIVVLNLPELEMLHSYPTIGPTGIVHTNVNGIAASIELFLGKDVLVDDEYGFIPVQWTGYDHAIKQYQGEVMQKHVIHERFRKKIQLCREQPCSTKDADWDGMRIVLKRIFSSFHTVDGAKICTISDNW